MAAVSTLKPSWSPSIKMRPLRILLSAYACEPDRGSEPGIGWQWATRLARCGHEVHVITRANNADAIARAMAEEPIPNLHFEYFDLPTWARFWKRGGRGVQLYYFLWQLATFPLASRLHRKNRFDVVHHITFGVFRHPSCLAFLDAPFVFGPVGGGERAPMSLRRGLPFKASVSEVVRDLANVYARIDPLLRSVLKRTAKILCKTEETRSCMPRTYRPQCEVFLEIGTEQARNKSEWSISREQTNRENGNALRVLYVGRLIYLKGLHLALPAFARLLQTRPDARFTIVGSGPQADELRRISEQLDIEHAVEWVPWLPRAQVLETYPQHDVFLFPSFHDSSGNAVLEAMTAGLPVVCLKRGGPATIVDAFSGICIEADEPTTAIQQLGDALRLLAGNPLLREHLARGAFTRANNYFSWRNQVERMNALYYSLHAQAELKAFR
jgi:glycosyltransferase involved in cell wall biosynthesis